jgi:hypothetical protein
MQRISGWFAPWFAPPTREAANHEPDGLAERRPASWCAPGAHPQRARVRTTGDPRFLAWCATGTHPSRACARASRTGTHSRSSPRLAPDARKPRSKLNPDRRSAMQSRPRADASAQSSAHPQRARVKRAGRSDPTGAKAKASRGTSQRTSHPQRVRGALGPDMRRRSSGRKRHAPNSCRKGCPLIRWCKDVPRWANVPQTFSFPLRLVFRAARFRMP